MSALRKWIYLLVLIGLAACAPAATQSPATPALPATTATPGDTLFIRYHRSGGIAGVDETWLIYADGRVEHTGRSSGHPLQLSASPIKTKR